MSIDQRKENAVEEFCDQFISYLQTFETFISNEQSRDAGNEIKYAPFLSLISQFIQAIDPQRINERFKISDKIRHILSIDNPIRETVVVESPTGPANKVIDIPAATSIITAAKMIAIAYEKYVGNNNHLNQLKDITTLISFKKLSYLVSDKFKQDIANKSQESKYFEIVFSTKPSDLLGMSIRADWSSCQNLLIDKDKHNVKAINSVISPNVGIIYLTNQRDYSGRGEEMIARALVFLLESEKDDSKALNISKVYSNYDPFYVMDIFNQSLSKHSHIPVILSPHGYYFPSVEESTENLPYFDDPAMYTKLPKSANSR